MTPDGPAPAADVQAFGIIVAMRRPAAFLPSYAPRRARGFTWIELTMVVAVIGILALMAIPGIQENMLKKQVKEALDLAKIAKDGVQAAWSLTGEMPNNNEKAGLPPKHKIVGNLVKEVSVDDGAITITMGNNASKTIEGTKVTLRPAVVNGEPLVPIAWVCHNTPVPGGMEIRGSNETNIEPKYLPVECRGGASKK